MFENWKGAVIYLEKQGDEIVAAAAHVWITPDGFAFVCPGYIYPETAHLNHFHRVKASVSQVGKAGAEFSGDESSGRIEPWGGSPDQVKAAGDSLDYYYAELDRLGTNYIDERANLAQILGDDIAAPLTDA